MQAFVVSALRKITRKIPAPAVSDPAWTIHEAILIDTQSPVASCSDGHLGRRPFVIAHQPSDGR